jgi:hypothetical protein
MIRIIYLILVFTITHSLFSQNPIRETDIHFKKTMVRSIPLLNECNQKLFGPYSLNKILLDAYNCNLITGFKNSSCSDTLSIYSFINEMYQKGDSSLIQYVYLCSSLELTEEIIVDKHRSEIVFKPISISLMIPPSHSTKGILEPLISFRFEDCAKIFNHDKKAIAINPLLNGRNINYTDVFQLKLYSSYIVKIGREDEMYFDQMASDPQTTFLIGKAEENKLTEYLYKLFNPK